MVGKIWLIKVLNDVQIMISKGRFPDIVRFPPKESHRLVIRIQWPNSRKD